MNQAKPRVIALYLLTSMACAPPAFVRLRSVLTVNTPATEPAEVVVGREVDRLRGRIARVAVSAPDDCIDFSSTSEAGTGTVESNVLHQRCAVELATLERALTAAGYSVVSWRQLRDVSGASSGAALLQAARTLGAQLILDVNALDWISRTRSAVNARWARTLHTSDPAGLLGEQLPAERFLPQSLSTIERYANAAEDELLHRMRRGAGLNLTVVSTEAGQTLLFYRRFIVEPYQSESVVNVLLQRNEDQYVAVHPTGMLVPPQAGTYRTSVEVTRLTRPDFLADDTHHRLLQELVTDCVAQIGTRFGPPAAIVPIVPVEPRRAEAPPPLPPAPPPQPIVGVALPIAPPAPAPPQEDRRERRRRHHE
jgi:hypothetical protein